MTQGKNFWTYPVYYLQNWIYTIITEWRVLYWEIFTEPWPSFFCFKFKDLFSLHLILPFSLDDDVNAYYPTKLLEFSVLDAALRRGLTNKCKEWKKIYIEKFIIRTMDCKQQSDINQTNYHWLELCLINT